MTRLRFVETPDGCRLEASHVLAAPAEEAWALLVDTWRWPDWGPPIAGVESTDRRVREGTVGRVQVELPAELRAGPSPPRATAGTVSNRVLSGRRLRTGRGVVGGWLPFEVTDWSPATRRWTWRVARLPPTGHRVDDLTAGRCRLAFELPPVSAGYAPVCLRALERLEALLTDGADGRPESRR